MKKRLILPLLVFALVAFRFAFQAGAAEAMTPEEPVAIARATGRFTMDVAPHSARQASTSFPLEVGEVVTIKASYSPFNASVDFGLIDSSGIFHYVTITGGSIDQEIEITKRDTYTFAVRNNSSSTVSVTGFVNY